MNPSALTIKGLIKLHKADQPIRPVVNWRNAPAYKLARLFTDKLNLLAPLPNAFNIKNAQNLLRNLENITMLPQYSMASLDITYLYPSIPINETRTILQDMLIQQQVNSNARKALLEWYYTITQQNYFTHKDRIMIQQEGLAMGAPSPGLIAEIFLQYIEHTQLIPITHRHKIIDCGIYVDDIFLIFDSSHSKIQDILEDFNALHLKLHFTFETVKDSKLHYLDITLQKTPVGIKTAIHRKHTFTDAIIPFTSNHPPAQKFGAIRHMYNRLETYKLNQEEHDQELQTIHNIMHNNSFPVPLHKPRSNTPTERSSTNPAHKWAVFTYIGKETTHITNI
jgi:hypothetical protein